MKDQFTSMTSRERAVRTLLFETVDRAPRDLWGPPGIRMFRSRELDEVLEQFPLDIGEPKFRYGNSNRARGSCETVGTYVDEWGCKREVAEAGIIGEVKEPILASWRDLDNYELPWELLDEADLSEVNRCCAESNLFINARTKVRPFEQMQFLRGTENLLIDLGYGTKEVKRLRDMLHGFFVKEMRMWAATDVDGVTFMDDWGTQTSLLISPELWRSFFKPLYREYCEIIHGGGKFAFYHSDGFIEPIIGDLIDVGIDALNSQLFCMNIERIAEHFRGKVTFWGEIDRQRILPFGTKAEVAGAVRRVRAALDTGSGGVIAQCSWGLKDPKENIETVFREWLREA